MSVISNNQLAGASGQGSSGYEIERSLRFNKEDSAYLSRTFGSGNQKKWTFSCWVKRNKVTTNYDTILSSSTNPIALDGTNLYFLSDQLYFDAFSTTSLTFRLKTFPRFRDYSAWYHIVAVFDSDNSTDTERAILYVNGAKISQGNLATNTKPASGISPNFNNAKVHAIGRRGAYGTSPYNGANITLAETYFVDGQALAPTDFGETDNNGVWQPKEFTGTYGPLVDQSQTWTTSVTNQNSTYTADKAFSGIVSGSNLWSNNGSASVLTLSSALDISGKTVVVYGAASSGANQILINNKSITGWPTSTNSLTPLDITSQLSGDTTLTSIEVRESNAYFQGIKVGGNLLVNSGISLVDNSFYLDFSDNSSTSALGTDSSGNNNDFTATNFSVTAGAGNDSLLDSPTNNFATLNPIHAGANVTLSNGNLLLTTGSTHTYNTTGSTIAVSSGKWLCEVTVDTLGPYTSFGVSNPASVDVDTYMGIAADSYTWFAFNTGGTYVNSAYTSQTAPWGSSSGTFPAAGDVIGMALDMDAGTLKYYKNGSLIGTAFTGITGTVCFCDGTHKNSVHTYNFGQRPFAHPVTGYKALCTNNLTNPPIQDPSKHFDIELRESDTSQTTHVTSLSFQPDLLWEKNRDASSSHYLMDAVRGSTKALQAETNAAESTLSTYITSFNSNGYSIGTGDFTTSSNVVGYAWEAGTGTAADNTDGSITSQVLANPSAGFSIVSVTAAAHADGSTVGHGLNAKPAMIIEKNRDSTSAWYTQHSGLGNMSGSYLELDTTSAKTTDNTWNLAEPTTSVISHDPGYRYGSTTADVIYYCFTPVEGYSSFGTYTGNGSADGPFVYTGFRTRWLLVKSSSSTSPWTLVDADRSGSLNPANDVIWADSNSAEVEYSSAYHFDLLSNGFKVRSTTTDVNTSGHTYVYAAFAEHPFKNARAR